MSLPRVVIAAPGTGQGKTTVATGLMAAMRARGLEVSGHKVGPDYIDPGYHALACGRPGRNLDPHLVGEPLVAPLLLHGALVPRPADVAVIEGVMGLYDGRIGTDGFASTAHVAGLLEAPVVLIVDISRASRTVGAVVHGLASYDPSVRVAGVILNQAGSPRHAAEVASSVRVPVLGTIPRDKDLATPSRHLGLVTAAEREESAALITALGERIAECVDLDAVLEVARSAPGLDVDPWTPTTTAATSTRPVVAMAAGPAFTFRYAETTELLEAAGCDVVTFDPTVDPLPRGAAGLYLGGGFPEVHAEALAANGALLSEIRAAVADGLPTVAECGGLLYLCRTLDGAAMVGAIDAEARMVGLTLRYPEVTAPADSLLGRTGETVTGHEFHHTTVEPVTGLDPTWVVDGEAVGFGSDTLHASYVHTHWAGHSQLAQRFADAVHAHSPRPSRRLETPTRPTIEVESAPIDADSTWAGVSEEALRHHGDVEATAGLVDLAVNVYPGPRPVWLEEALRASLDDVGRYPDPQAAERAVAEHHGVDPAQVLLTAGAAEAFSLLARRPWVRPAVVHPQFTEPHAALLQAGHDVTEVRLPRPFVLDPALVRADVDLVVVGNPTNPTGVLHPSSTLLALRAPHRLLVVDEAFMDTIPGETESILGESGALVIRSLTKHWSIPGIRAGYVVGEPDLVAKLRRAQVPWSVSTTAIAASTALATAEARAEARRRADEIATWRTHLERRLTEIGVDHVPSTTSFVLARVGEGVHARLREQGIAVRRADTFPGLGPEWVRIAVRPPDVVDRVTAALS